MKMVRPLVTLSLGRPRDAAAAVSPAQESPLRFLHALQANGYGDMAVEYLKIARKEARPAARDSATFGTWRCRRATEGRGGRGLRRQGARALMGESQQYLAKFIKEKPDHPEAITAMAGGADFLTQASPAIDPASQGRGRERTRRNTRTTWPTPARPGRCAGEVRERREASSRRSWPSCRRPRNRRPRRTAAATRPAEAREQTDANL